MVLVFILLIVGFHGLIFSLLKDNGAFNIKSVNIEGLRTLQKEDIIKLSEIKRGANILDVNLFRTAVAVSAKANVKTAVVERILPSEIKITVNERVPIAYVNDTYGSYLCDADAVVLNGAAYNGYPVIKLDFRAHRNGNELDDRFVTGTLKTLAVFAARKKIREVVLSRKKVIIRLRGLNTAFFIGNKIPSVEILRIVVALGDTIRRRNLKLSYVDVNKKNPIGFK